MAEKRVIRLIDHERRMRAHDAIDMAPDGYVVIVQEPTRSLEQNAKFHAICGELAALGVKWFGKPRDAAAWKVLLVSGHAVATGCAVEAAQGLEGELVALRESTATMGKSRGSSLIEYSEAFLALQRAELAEAA